jgi:2-polyprenyl-6-hydroxyphenyl methylase/3-demethylubiquinone-9 3-methyltransferase
MIPRAHPPIDNAIYDTLGERWYSAQDDPVALLRAESRLRNPWVSARILAELGPGSQRVLDVGCGAGFLANHLASQGHAVTAVDLSLESLGVGRQHDATGHVRYLPMDAHRLSFADASFDVVCSMDFLEHTETPEAAVREAGRVLRPGGLFFFHTFNRNPLCGLVVIRGVEWFVRNTPAHLHVYSLFVKPSELRGYLERADLRLQEWHGVRPRLGRAFLRLLLQRRVPDDFAFTFTRAKLMGYTGEARRGPFTAGRVPGE